MDNNPLSFCSPDHYRTGVGRWIEKRKAGIRPGIPQRKEEPEAVGDNLNEIEEVDNE